MVRTVEFDNNVQIVKDLEKLSGCDLNYWYFHGRNARVSLGAFSFGNPLERLGLYIKDDFLVDEEEKEEGEILS